MKINKATLLLSAVILSYFSFLPSFVTAENLRIGYIGALTGDAAAIGREIASVLEVSIAELNRAGGINDRQVELLVEDDGYEVKKTISAYEKLKTRVNSNLIFMTTYGGLFALGKRAEADGILLLDTLDCNEDLVKISRHHTCLATRTESIAEAFLKKIHSTSAVSIGVLYEQEAWFNFIVNELKKDLGQKLIEVIAPVQSGDYRAEVLKFKKAKVDHIIFLGNDAMGQAMAQARGFGIKAQFYSIASVTSPGFSGLAGEALNGTLVSNWLIPRSSDYENFAKKFKAQQGRDIILEFVAGPSHDAANLVARAMKKLYKKQSNVTATDLRAAMVAEDAFDGISGKIKMDEDGAVKSIKEVLFKYDSGKLLALN